MLSLCRLCREAGFTEVECIADLCDGCSECRAIAEAEFGE